MKKILICGMIDNLGGIETFLYNLVIRLNKEKYQISFLKTIEKDVCFEQELKEMGFEFCYVHPRRKGVFRHNREVRSLLRKKHFDIVHINLVSLSYYNMIRIARKEGIKVIIHSHNSSCPQKFVSLLLHSINRTRLPKNDKHMKYIAVSDVAGKYMFKNRGYIVINNGIDIDKFRFSEEKRLAFRKSNNISDSTKLIINIGNFKTQKNHGFLIEIFSEYHKLQNDSLLVLVGTGPLERKIYEKVKMMGLQDKVLFIGDRSDVSDVLSGGDFFVFPSISEGFSIALLEAEISGIQCVCSENVSKEVIIDDTTIEVGLDKSATEWANIINSMIVKRTFDADKTKKFSVKKEVEEIEKVYDGILYNQ